MNVLDTQWSAAELHERERRADEYRRKVRRERRAKAGRLAALALRILTVTALLTGWAIVLMTLMG